MDPEQPEERVVTFDTDTPSILFLRYAIVLGGSDMVPLFRPKGRYIHGAFYQLRWEFSDLWKEELEEFRSAHPTSIVVPPALLTEDDQIVKVRSLDIDDLDFPPCPQCGGLYNARHEPPPEPSRPKTADVALEGRLAEEAGLCAELINPILPDYPWGYAGCALFLRHDVAEEILDAGFTGAELVRASISWSHEPYQDADEFSGISLFVEEEEWPELVLVCENPSDNRCPYCGQTPLWCERCGDGQWGRTCWRCEEEVHFRWDETPPLSWPGFVKTRESVSEVHPIDLRKWSGQDILRWYIDWPVVSRRLMLWLKERGYGPFVALPLNAYAEGLSAEQERLLERALGR